jgi:hypothetical protein
MRQHTWPATIGTLVLIASVLAVVGCRADPEGSWLSGAEIEARLQRLAGETVRP